MSKCNIFDFITFEEEKKLNGVVNTVMLASVLDLTPRRVQQLVKEGLPRIARDTWNLAACARWYIKYLKEKGAVETVLDQRLRLEKAKAEKMELELLEKKRLLLERSEVSAAIQVILTTLRLEFLGLPGRLARELAGIDNSARVKALLSREIKKALNRVSEALENYD